LDSNAIPFHTSCAKKLTLNQTPVITVTGKAFFDVGHSLKDQNFCDDEFQMEIHDPATVADMKEWWSKLLNDLSESA
jgi:hypothetical protein